MPTAGWPLKPWNNQRLFIRLWIDPTTISGQKGIFGQELLLPYSITEHDHDDPVILHLISLEGRIGWNGEGDFLAKLHIPSQTFWENPNEQKLHVPITDAQIEAIEEARKGNQVNLAITFGGVAVFQARSEYVDLAETAYAKRVGNLVPVESATSGYLGIEREHWLRILSQLGAGTRRLVELPEPRLPRGKEHWAECMRLLDGATQFYRTGEYEQALVNCRQITEGIPHVLCEVWGLPQKTRNQSVAQWIQATEPRLVTAWPDDRLSAGMLRTMFTGCWQWLAPAPHYGTGIPLREEVIVALGLCTDLLLFGSLVLEAHPGPIAQ